MITDPKTVPMGRVARIAFAACVALVSTLLIAPQTTEFSSKVALLAGLVVMCAARYPLERLFPAARSEEDRPGAFVRRLTTVGDMHPAPRRAFAHGAIGGATAVLLVSGMVVAGASSGTVPQTAGAQTPPAVTAHVDPSALPPVTVDRDVAALSDDLAGSGAQELGVTLAENLETETQALLDADKELLSAVDFGDRLSEMQQRFDDAIAAGTTDVDIYAFDSIHIGSVIRAPGQGALSLGVETTGTVEEVTYDADGNRTDRTSAPFSITFVLAMPTGDRWLIAETRPLP
jgi:YD repeat-containing protein